MDCESFSLNTDDTVLEHCMYVNWFSLLSMPNIVLKCLKNILIIGFRNYSFMSIVLTFCHLNFRIQKINCT